MGDILFLAHRIPYPPDRGDRMRSWHLLKALAALAPVHLIAFADDVADIDAATPILPMLASHLFELRRRSRMDAGLRALATGRPISLSLFDSAAMRARVAAILAAGRVDTIFAFSGQMAQFVPDDWRGRFVMDFVDVDSAKFGAFATARGPMAWVNAREARLLAAFEAETARRASLSLFVSDAEAALFRSRAGADRVATLENGIDLDRYDPTIGWPRPAGAEAPLIVFTGQMDYRPNIDAVVRFARETMPMIRARRADAGFAIVGRKPTAEVRRLSDLPGVIVTGAVEDVRPWIAAAAVAVAPLALARGVQNKLLEAMAMARPVVGSSAAAQGIDAKIIIADGSAAEAEAVVTLLNDPALALEIGAAARARMVARYGWPARLAGLAAMVGRDRAEAA